MLRAGAKAGPSAMERPLRMALGSRPHTFQTCGAAGAAPIVRRLRRFGPLWRWSFGAHVVALVIVGILPLAGLGLYSMTRLADDQREIGRRQIVSTARVISSSLDQRLLGVERTLRALASTLPPDGRDFADFYADCRAVARESGGWILLADRDGQPILNTQRPLGTTLSSVLSSSEFKRAIAAGETQISDVFTATTGVRPELAVHLPILEDGEVAHVLTMIFPTSTLIELMAQQNLPEGWTVSALDRTGTVLAQLPRAGEVVGTKVSEEIRDLPESWSQPSFLLAHRDNADVDIASARSARTGW
jgi:hypothetical protein